MSERKSVKNFIVAILFWLVLVTPASAALIDNFNSWTQVQDPAHLGMTGTVDNDSQATLIAAGLIPAATDIGYQSVDGTTVATSLAGHYFKVGQDFHIAVDFDVSEVDSVGLAGIGFGIGEDSAGMNSAGPGLAIFNGNPSAFGGAARIDDSLQGPIPFGPGATSSGRFFAQYDSSSGDIIYGVNTTPGSDVPSHTGTFLGLQNNWGNVPLLASFFLRSDTLPAFGLNPLTSGTLTAVFSNFEVLQGTASAVPLPGAVWLFGAALGGFAILRRKPLTC